MEVSALDNEHPNSGPLVIDRDAKISLTVNNPMNSDELEIDLFQVFSHMGKSAGFFLWLMILFIVIGLCIPSVHYLLSRPPMTVSSAVTLNYQVPDKLGNPVNVSDLTAPDGKPLDLNQITSSYVLQNALCSLELSAPVGIENLRGNITISRIPTEESNQQMELISKMIADKSSTLYQQLSNVEFVYSNRFVISLKNGFGQPDSRRKIYLKDDELSLVLNSILSSYNSYLVKTYADSRLPDNPFDLITVEGIDNLQLMTTLNSALDQLYNYCSQKPSDIRSYRSWRTGKSLNDLMNDIQMVQSFKTYYTESMIQSDALVTDIADTNAYYQFRQQDAQQKIDSLNETISALTDTISNYRNDEVVLSVQGAESQSTARTNTDSYNALFISQADNYSALAALQYNSQMAQARLSMLESQTHGTVTEAVTAEIQSAIVSAQRIYDEIKKHMEELFQSASFTTFLEYSAAYGKPVSFFKSYAKPLMIGGGAGFALALMFWFMYALRLDIIESRKRFAEMEANRR